MGDFIILLGIVFFIWSLIRFIKNRSRNEGRKKVKNLLIAGLSFLVIGSIVSPDTKENAHSKQQTELSQKKKTTITSASTITTKKSASSSNTKEKASFTLTLPAEVEVNKDNYTEIKGKTLPNTTVKLDSSKDSADATTTADKTGNFSFKYQLTDDHSQELNVIATSKKRSKDAKITVKPNTELLAEKKQKEIEEQEAKRKAQEQAAQQEAQRKAQEQAAQQEAQRKAQEQAAQQEAQRKAQEQAAQQEAQRKAQEQAAQQEAQRQAQEQAVQQQEQAQQQTPTQQNQSSGITGYCKDGSPASGDPSARGKANSCYGHGGWVR